MESFPRSQNSREGEKPVGKVAQPRVGEGFRVRASGLVAPNLDFAPALPDDIALIAMTADSK
jgi:hypothetical protein